MADIQGFAVARSSGLNCKKDEKFDRLQTYRSELFRIKKPVVLATLNISKGGPLKLPQNAAAYVVPNYYADFYRNIKLIPKSVSLGAIAVTQSFDFHIWNANRHSVRLERVEIEQGDGISLSGGKAPYVLQGLALQKWTVKVNISGPPEIDCRIRFKFEDGTELILPITGSRAAGWYFFPDWSENIVETLEFLTTVHQSLTGAEQRIAKRLTPRRTFEFKLNATGAERQRLENMFYFAGVTKWSLPIFPQQTPLAQAIGFGDKRIYLKTKGLDIYQGGQAVLIEGVNSEKIAIERIHADYIETKTPIANNFSVQAVFYPLRAAVLTDMPQINRLSDDVLSVQLRLQISEHNDYSRDVSHLPVYRGHPVLEPASEWSEDITAQYQRLIKTLDNGTGLPYYLDTALKAFQVTSHRFLLEGAESQRQLRQLFYYLRGRQKAIWVATASSDLTLTADIIGKSMDVAFVSYTTSLLKQTGRQDVRIELHDGTIIYRRIIAAVVLNADEERLSLDGEALNIERNQVAKISYLTLSRLESDTISWVHHTNSVASVNVSFRGLRDELENSL